MIKKIRVFIVILLILLMIYIPISYANQGNLENPSKEEQRNNKTIEKQEDDFLEVDSTEKELGSELNMYLNIANIEYEKFKFKLTSSININNVDVENNNEIQVEKKENSFYLIVNKGELNIEKIILNYTIPNNLNVGDKFTLIGEVINQSDNIEEQESKSKQIEISIIEKKENNQDKKEENNIEDNEKELNLEDINNKNNIQNQETSNLQNVQKFFSTTGGNNSSSLTTTVTYNGSDNNYLKELVVDEYELNTEFSKDNTTYFLNVENDVTSLKISTTREDSSSKVCIYGNDSLEEGSNKVLISVTAENGNVRSYRIYVTRKSI